MMRRLSCAVAILALAACTTLHEPVPDGFKGPTAELSDTVVSDDDTKAQFFVVLEIDGKPVSDSIYETRKAGDGTGLLLTIREVSRAVPVALMKVRLVGRHETATASQAIASRIAGSYFAVEGVVDFTPVAGARYVVKGELAKDGSSVWIEDAATKKPVTDKVRSK